MCAVRGTAQAACENVRSEEVHNQYFVSVLFTPAFVLTVTAAVIVTVMILESADSFSVPAGDIYPRLPVFLWREES